MILVMLAIGLSLAVTFGFMRTQITSLQSTQNDSRNDLALEAAVHAVVLQHVGQVVGLQQVVDADDLDVVSEVLHRSAEHHAADAAEAVDADADGHGRTPGFVAPV